MVRVAGTAMILALSSSLALAQAAGPGEGGAVKIGQPPAGEKLAKADCEAVWSKANPTKSDKITAGAAQPFLTDAMAANTDGDMGITLDEFMAACDKGLIKKSAAAGGKDDAATGAGVGTEGSGPTP